MESTHKPYPSDVSDEEWAFVAPYLTLIPLDAKQRQHDLREMFNALGFIVKTGMQWRFMPNDLPPWPAVYQQTQRWIAAGSFEAIVHDLRVMLRLAAGRGPAEFTLSRANGMGASEAALSLPLRQAQGRL